MFFKENFPVNKHKYLTNKYILSQHLHRKKYHTNFGI